MTGRGKYGLLQCMETTAPQSFTAHLDRIIEQAPTMSTDEIVALPLLERLAALSARRTR